MDAAGMKRILTAALLPENRPAAGILATEIESPDGARRGDAIWAPFGRGQGLHGYEIKVSRADVMVEIRDATKCEPWLQFCERWWLFIADPALIHAIDVPEHWGIAAPPSGRRTRSLTILRPAPKLKPVDSGEAWKRITTWQSHRQAETIREANAALHSTKQSLQSWKAEAEKARNGAAGLPLHFSQPLAQQVATRVAHAVHDAGIYIASGMEEEFVELVAEAVVNHLAVRRHARDRLRLIERHVASVNEALAGLGAAPQTAALRAVLDRVLAEESDADQVAPNSGTASRPALSAAVAGG